MQVTANINFGLWSSHTTHWRWWVVWNFSNLWDHPLFHYPKLFKLMGPSLSKIWLVVLLR